MGKHGGCRDKQDTKAHGIKVGDFCKEQEVRMCKNISSDSSTSHSLEFYCSFI